LSDKSIGSYWLFVKLGFPDNQIVLFGQSMKFRLSNEWWGFLFHIQIQNSRDFKWCKTQYIVSCLFRSEF